MPRSVWPIKAIEPIYRLRWRIEMIFKAGKSHLRLRQLNSRTRQNIGAGSSISCLKYFVDFPLQDAKNVTIH